MTTDQPSITCPVCHMTSYNPNDIREGYCGNCHAWTAVRLTDEDREHLNCPPAPPAPFNKRRS